jgi:hypothetical protein
MEPTLLAVPIYPLPVPAYSSQDSTEEPTLNITPPTVVRVTRAAGAMAAVSVARSVRLALDDDAVAVMAVDEQGKEEGDEEEDAVPTSVSIPSPLHL